MSLVSPFFTHSHSLPSASQLSAHCSLDLEEALTNERLAHAETQRLLVASHSDNERLRDAVRALQADLFAAHTTALSMPSSSVDLSTFNPTTNALESHAALVGTADSATSDVAAKSRVAPLTPSSKSVSSAMAAHLLTPPSRVIGAPLFGTPAFLEPDDLAVANAGVMTPVSADAPMKESAASALLTVERDGIDSSHTTSLTNAVVPIRHEFSDIHVSAAFASAASTRMGLVQSDDGYLLSSSLAPTLKPEQIEITDVRQNSPIPSYASSAEASSVPSQLSAYESTANLMSFVSSLFALKSGQRPALVDSEYSVHRRVADEWSECADLAIDGCDLSMHSAASSLGLEGLQLQPDSARQLPDDEVSNPLLNRDIAIEPPPQWHVDESDPSFDALGLVPPISPAALFVASASSASPLLTSPAPSAPASGDHSEANDRMLEGTIESAQSISAQSMSSLAETISSSSSILILSDISSISISPRSGDEFWALQPGTPMNHSSASSCLSSSSRVSLGKSAVASPAAAGVWVPGASVAAIPEGDESAHMRSPHQSLASAPPASSSASSSSSAAPVPPASSLFPPISMSMLSVSSTSASTSALRTVDVIPPRLSLSARNWQPYVAPSLPDSAASSSSSSSSSSLSAHASSTSATSSSTAMRAGRQPLAPVNPRRDVAVSGNADDDGFLSSFVRMCVH